MKHYCLIYLSIFLFLFVGCTLPDTDLEPANSQPAQCNTIQGEQGAIRIVEEFISIMGESDPLTRSAATTVAGVISKPVAEYSSKTRMMTRSAADEVPAYEVTLRDGDGTNGFAVVVGETAQSLVAFVPQGSIADTTFNKGLAVWFTDLAENISASLLDSEIKTRRPFENPLTEPVQDSSIKLWTNIPGTEEFVRNISTSYEYTDKSYSAIMLPFTSAEYNNGARINTSWHQGSPYNDFCEGTMIGGGNCSIGCFATATSQIIAYHGILDGFSFDFGTMTDSPNVTPGTAAATEAALLNMYVARMGKTRYNPETGAGSVYNVDVVPALKQMGYTALLYTGNDYMSRVESEIKAGRPAMLAGLGIISNGQMTMQSGHIWVVDGVLKVHTWRIFNRLHVQNNVWEPHLGYHDLYTWNQYREKIWCMYLHMVWGWGGSSDGFYCGLKPKNHVFDYTYDKHLYYNIAPN